MRILLLLTCIGVLAFAAVKGLPMLSGSSSEEHAEQAVLYVAGNDPAAVEIVQFLRTRGVSVRVLDVDTDVSARAEFVRLGGGQLPLLMLHGTRVEGHQPWDIERVLARHEHQQARQ